ncbi:hypothetical protein SteCoe_13057 [Stentor coeruleus]|uniref:Uncharacterized protein n=1 Tax=Stentor coeruleus TaxID=5963 RepID=A0A1R2C9C2_9CILI|nr:hypothetical protein SteCoe_13057 [Stentor coeruleus]
MNKIEISETSPPKLRFYSESPQRNKKNTLKRLPKLKQNSFDSDANINYNEKYISFLNSIEQLCDSYGHLPTIEFEADIDTERCYSTTEKPKHMQKQDTKLSFIINQLKLRIKNYPKAQAAYPASSRFKIISGTEEKVGPGSYQAMNSDKLETYEFSNIPRLHTPIAHTLHTIESLYKRRGEISLDAIIKKNKLSVTNPQQIRDELALKINYFKHKEQDVKIKKHIIDLKQKYDKTYKLSEKTRKFQWRMTKKEVFSVQLAWSGYIVCIGMLTVLNLSAKVRRVKRIKWGKILRKFSLASRCVGRFMINLKAGRKKIVSKRIMNFKSPFYEYIRQDILIKKKIIQGIVEKSREMPVIIHLMAKWRSRIVMVQRNVRNIKKVYKAREYALSLLWEKSLESIQKTRIKEKIHRSVTIDRIYVMPNIIKERFIKKFMKDIIMNYADERRKYLQILKNMKNQGQNSKERINLMSKVKKPTLVLLNQMSKIAGYIERANTYKAKLEKKQRNLRYNICQPQELAKTLKRNYK